MEYIVIRNKGLIVEEDLYLIGSSTKRNDTSKIGLFGSGWKYALAWFMRNDCKISVYSGMNKIEIDTIEVNHRGHIVKVITINGKHTSITTEMGPDWTGWMAIREMISNAIDEGEFEIELDSSITPKEEYSTIYIQSNAEVKDVFDNFNHYFAFDRENAITLENTYHSGYVKYYIKSSASKINVYRKGIRCYETETQSYFDIDIENIDINESRLCGFWDMKNAVSKSINSPNLTIEVMRSILLSADSLGLDLNEPTEHIIILLQEEIKKGVPVTSHLYVSMLGFQILRADTLILPSAWYYELVKRGIIEDDKISYFGEDVPRDFVNKAAEFDSVALINILSEIVPKIKIVSGVFENKYEGTRVVKTTVFMRYDLKDTIIDLAANILCKIGYSNWRSILTERVSASKSDVIKHLGIN